MVEKPDFGNDLSTMTEEITAELGDVLQALSLQKKKPASKTVEFNTAHAPKPRAETSSSPSGETPRATNDEAAKPRAPRREQRTAAKSALDDDVLLQNVTTRLRPDTNALLTEAALRQKLKKTVPDTRQDIIEEALQEWLRRHGYNRRESFSE